MGNSTTTSSPPIWPSGFPEIYARLGYVDFQVIKDTIIVDRARGKALLDLTISEGKQYRVGTFDVIGNRHFSTEEIRRFYPFTPTSATLTERATDLLLERHRPPPGRLRPQPVGRRDDQAPHGVQQRGLHLRIDPSGDGTRRWARIRMPRVNLRWEIDERNPAIINRIEITGNDYTTEGLHSRCAGDHPGRRVQPGPPDPQLPEPRQPRLLRHARFRRRTCGRREIRAATWTSSST